MEQQLQPWVDEYGNDFVETLMREDFHAVNFDFAGMHYCFAGWWILDWDEGDKTYDSKKDFVKDRIFNGKSITEIQCSIENAEFEFE